MTLRAINQLRQFEMMMAAPLGFGSLGHFSFWQSAHNRSPLSLLRNQMHRQFWPQEPDAVSPRVWFLGSNGPPIVSHSQENRTLSLRLL